MENFDLIKDNLISLPYYKDLDRRLQVEKIELLNNWIREDLLDEELLKTYFSIRVDDEVFSNLLEYSLHKEELVHYEFIKRSSEILSNSQYDIFKEKFL